MLTKRSLRNARSQRNPMPDPTHEMLAAAEAIDVTRYEGHTPLPWTLHAVTGYSCGNISYGSIDAKGAP